MIRVTSEIGKLQKVIIHTPDDGIEQVTPDKAVEYLYEDIVYLDKMRKEHNVLRKLLECFIGENNVLDIQDLLFEVCRNEVVRKELIQSTAQFEEVDGLEQILGKMSPKELAYSLITGVVKKTKKILFPPASNYIFCRDIGVVVNNHLLITQANKRARSRESLLSWYVYHYSKTFEIIHRNNWFIKLSNDMDNLIENIIKPENEFSVEGGDVMMFGNDHLLIGCSERTSKYAFEKIKEIIFKWKIVKHVVMVEIPKERYCMHLDTIFTRIDTNVCVVFEPLIMRKGKISIKRFEQGIEEPFIYNSLADLLTEINPNMKFIACGGGITPHQEREQWTDGCNLFAIKPGVAVTYDRNKMTTKAIAKAGYKVMKAEYLIKKLKSGELKAETIEKTLILIPSNELSRARGGTHCLTFPILRES
ncbi:MAG: arginine deiminase family protein [Bacteroidota bacterium]|nr:arginine deiminase family protein [Bacteroidota bacterium]